MTDLTPIPDSELDALERLREKAEPGPWRADVYGDGFQVAIATPLFPAIGLANRWDDANLLVAAVNALPRLIRTVREQRAEIARLRAQVDAARKALEQVMTPPGRRPGDECEGCGFVPPLHDPNWCPIAISQGALAALDGKEKS